MTRTEFIGYLRDALNYLYDPDRLSRNPLGTLFGTTNRPDSYSALQSILKSSIESFEPSLDTPIHSRAWRIFDLLSFRYLQQQTVEATANQLGMSIRHLRREQNAALNALADRLWELVGKESKPFESQADLIIGDASVNHEFERLKEMKPEEPILISTVMTDVSEIIQPLLIQRKVGLVVRIPGDLPHVAVHPLFLTEALLNIFNYATSVSTGSGVVVSARRSLKDVEISIQGGQSAGNQFVETDADVNEMAYKLAKLCGGSLQVSDRDDPFLAVLRIPIFEQVSVLAVDDNPDALLLLNRYTAGTRYQVTGATDPELLFDLVEKTNPQIIVLDVMIPKIDGWKLLGRLKHNQNTHSRPILVCTILPQEDLAKSLGADAFLRKPFTQEGFLTALDQLSSTIPHPNSDD